MFVQSHRTLLLCSGLYCCSRGGPWMWGALKSLYFSRSAESDMYIPILKPAFCFFCVAWNGAAVEDVSFLFTFFPRGTEFNHVSQEMVCEFEEGVRCSQGCTGRIWEMSTVWGTLMFSFGSDRCEGHACYLTESQLGDRSQHALSSHLLTVWDRWVIETDTDIMLQGVLNPCYTSICLSKMLFLISVFC